VVADYKNNFGIGANDGSSPGVMSSLEPELILLIPPGVSDIRTNQHFNRSTTINQSTNQPFQGHSFMTMLTMLETS